MYTLLTQCVNRKKNILTTKFLPALVELSDPAAAVLRCVDAAPVGVISTGVVVCGVEGDVGARGVVVVELVLCLTDDGGVKKGVRGEVSGVK